MGYGRAGRIAALEILKDPELELAWVARREWPRTQGAPADAPHRLHLEGEEIRALSMSELAEHDAPQAHPVDLIVDLSGSSAIHCYAHFTGKGTRVVSAISHYEPGDLRALRRAARRAPVLHSPNITLGINLVLVLARVLRKLIPQADVQIIEEHFSAKSGRSGTAEQLARMLGLEADASIHSIRAGGIVGKHELIFGLPTQTIRLVHESVNRAAFARGALQAGKWLMEAEPDLYTMEKLVLRKMQFGFLSEIGSPDGTTADAGREPHLGGRALD